MMDWCDAEIAFFTGIGNPGNNKCVGRAGEQDKDDDEVKKGKEEQNIPLERFP